MLPSFVLPLCCGLKVLPWQPACLSSPISPDGCPIPAPLIERIVSLAAPPLCAACGCTRAPGAILCRGCEADLAAAPRAIEEGPPGVDLAVAASPFQGVARSVVHGLKYARRLALADVAAAAMLRALPRHEVVDAVVPVPAGLWRWRWRGFDPAEEIAIAVVRRSGLPLCACLRRGRGRRQVGRRRSERLADPPSVWAASECPGEALLVDDVWTTGATLSACARALREGGCRRVVALTLARTV
jgi:predicted amidophosphoribosyltransferase